MLVPRQGLRFALILHQFLLTQSDKFLADFSRRLDYAGRSFFLCLRAYLLGECLEGGSVDGAADVDVYRCGVAGRGRRARNPGDLGEMVVYGHRWGGNGRGHGRRQVR